MRVRKGVVLLIAAALALAGCATIPDSGEVEEGNADVQPVQPLQPIQEGPNPADDPSQIVTGFLRASAGGIASDFSVAREFLTADAAATWNPGAETLVYRSGAVTPDWDEETSTVGYHEVPLATVVDSSGRRSDSPEGALTDLSFSVVQDSQGRWRISELADGVVISQAYFTRFFRPVNLVFAAPDLTTGVPEVRWLPNNNVVTAAARELIEGPSPWLADAVVTGFPATAALAVESVVVSGSGVAAVDLSPQSAGSLEQRSLAAEQMRITLGALPGVTDVKVRIGGLPISTDEQVALGSAPVPDGQAAVFTQGRLGVWDGESLMVTGDEAGAVSDEAYGLARSYDGERIAFVQGDSLLTSGALGAEGAALVEYEPDLPTPAGSLAASAVHTGQSLVPPSFDRHGYVWTAEAAAGDGLVAVSVDGDVIELPSVWLQTRSAIALSVSRDGSMVAMLSRSGGQPVVEVAAIVRDSAGVPLGIGEPIPVGTGVGAGVDIVWLNDTTLAVLGEAADGSSSPLWLVSVGGGTTALATVQEAVDMAVRVGEPSLLVVGADGRVEERSGTAWAGVLDGVREVAYAG